MLILWNMSSYDSMLFISHRGNLDHKDAYAENTEESTDNAIARGFDVEIDVWFKDGGLWMGHDKPENKTSLEFLKARANRLWIHAKSYDTYKHLCYRGFRIFAHENEPYALVGIDTIWNHSSNLEFGANTVCVMPEISGVSLKQIEGCIAVCSDKISIYREAFKIISIRDIKVLILDVDGVLTNGRKIYGQSGTSCYKEFNDKDFTAIKKFQSLGIEVIWLSGDAGINAQIADSRNIPFVYGKNSENKLDKKWHLQKICKEKGVSPKEVCYVGDDSFDLDILTEVGVPMCPIDSVREVKDKCYILKSCGGDAVVSEIFDIWQCSTGKRVDDVALREIDSLQK